MNPNVYVGGNLLDGVDPSGLIILVHDKRSGHIDDPSNPPEDYKTARKWLGDNSVYASVYLTGLENSATKYEVIIKDPGSDEDIKENGIDDPMINHFIHWIPNYAYCAKTLGGGEAEYSPALLLFHEFAHLSGVEAYLPWADKEKDSNYDTKEEKRVIQGPEARVYFDTTRIHAVRATHGGPNSSDKGWHRVNSVIP